MKFSGLTPSERRTVTIGGSVVLASAIFVWGVRPFLASLTDAKDRLRIERETLARERAAVAQARTNPLLQLRADSAMALTTPRLFSGRDDVMASADLVAYLGDVTRKARVLLQDRSEEHTSELQSH